MVLADHGACVQTLQREYNVSGELSFRYLASATVFKGDTFMSEKYGTFHGFYHINQGLKSICNTVRERVGTAVWCGVAHSSWNIHKSWPVKITEKVVCDRNFLDELDMNSKISVIVDWDRRVCFPLLWVIVWILSVFSGGKHCSVWRFPVSRSLKSHRGQWSWYRLQWQWS